MFAAFIAAAVLTVFGSLVHVATSKKPVERAVALVANAFYVFLFVYGALHF